MALEHPLRGGHDQALLDAYSAAVIHAVEQVWTGGGARQASAAAAPALSSRRTGSS